MVTPSTYQNDALPCQKVAWQGRIAKCKIVNVPVDMPKRPRQHAKMTPVPVVMPKRRNCARRHAKMTQLCPPTCQKRRKCARRHTKTVCGDGIFFSLRECFLLGGDFFDMSTRAIGLQMGTRLIYIIYYNI